MKRLFISLAVAVALGAGFVSCNEDEDISLRDITLSSGNGNMLKPTETMELTVSFFPANTPDYKGLEWSSSDEKVVTVENGVITAQSPGGAEIKAVSKSNPLISGVFNVMVSENFVTVSGAVEGVWTKHSVVNVTDQIRVEHGKTLTVEEGVTIIVANGAVGATQPAPIEFYVEGSLYLRGTKEYPILVTVAENLRTTDNRYAGLWGGFTGGKNFQEMLFDWTVVEYCGAKTAAGSPSVVHGIHEKMGDPAYPILVDNPNGRIVVRNSVFRYVDNDVMYFMGAQAIVYNNILHTVGVSDGDGINVKAGVLIDIAYNLTFSVNSNALKLTSKNETPEREQTIVKAYNNTIVNSGWRRDKNLKGGSILIQQNVLAQVYNNLILNSRLRTVAIRLPEPRTDRGAHWGSYVGYNFYASGTQTWTGVNPTDAAPFNFTNSYWGYKAITEDVYADWDTYADRFGPDFPLIDKTSLFATAAGQPAIEFANFGFNTVPLAEQSFNSSWDFHVTSANSPVIVGADGYAPRSDFSNGFAPLFGTKGLMIDGVEIKSPAPKAQYGAFGVK